MRTTARPAAWESLWRGVARVQGQRLEPRIALRNMIGVAVPLVVGAASAHTGAGLIAATGALNVAFRDSHAPYPERARQLLAASLIAGVAVTAGSLSGTDALVAVVLAGAWAFGAGLLVALGERPANLGMMSVVLLAIFAAVPMSPRDAALAGLAACAGGVLQTLLAIALWPLGRHDPERRALAGLYRELACAALTPHQATEPPPATAQTLAVQGLLRRDRSVQSQRFHFLFSQAERTRLALLALARIRLRLEREAPTAPQSRSVEHGLDLAATSLTAVAETLGATARATPALEAASRAVENLAALADRLRDAGTSEPLHPMMIDARIQLEALAGQLRAALEVAGQSTPAAAPNVSAHRTWLRDSLSTLRANLKLESIACRHGIRMALCVAAGDALGRSMGFARPYWIPMTVALVLKPDFAATFSRGVLRLGGTYAGLLLATVLFHALPPGVAIQILVIAGLTFLARWAGGANYAFLALAVAALAVFLLSLDGAAPSSLIWARAIDTTLGGAIALVAYGLWPTWERAHVAEQLARMLDRFREYFRAAWASVGASNPSNAQRLEAARGAGRLTRTNLEATIERALAEPGTSRESALRLAGIQASARRLAYALMTLEAAIAVAEPLPPAFARFAHDVETTLQRLAAALRGTPLDHAAWPDLREDHHGLVLSGDGAQSWTLIDIEADRIINSLNTLRDEASQWISLRSETP